MVTRNKQKERNAKTNRSENTKLRSGNGKKGKRKKRKIKYIYFHSGLLKLLRLQLNFVSSTYSIHLRFNVICINFFRI